MEKGRKEPKFTTDGALGNYVRFASLRLNLDDNFSQKNTRETHLYGEALSSIRAMDKAGTKEEARLFYLEFCLLFSNSIDWPII